MGAERKIVQNAVFFRGKRHDNKSLKLQILLSKKIVVIAQAPAKVRNQKRLGMAMFRRTFARTIRRNVREPHMKMRGFETKARNQRKTKGQQLKGKIVS